MSNDDTLKTLNDAQPFKGYQAIRLKTGGVNSPGKYGAWYKSTSSGNEYLLKQDIRDGKIRHRKIISEFWAGRILNYLTNNPTEKKRDLSARVSLMKVDNPNISVENEEDKIYLASEGIKNYKNDFWKYAYEIWNQKHPNDQRKIPKDRPRGMGIIPAVKEVMVFGFDYIKSLNPDFDEEFAAIMAASLLVGDFDVHVGNIGIVADENGIPHLIRLDYGGALNNLKDEVEPHSITDHLPLLNPRFQMIPTNHFREYPRKYRITRAMAEQLERIADTPLSAQNHEIMEETRKIYGEHSPGFDVFAWHTGAQSRNDIENFLETKLAARQKSLKRYAFEIRIDLCLDKDTSGKFSINHEMLNALKEKYPEELFELYNQEKIRFRKAENSGIFDEPRAKETLLKALREHYSLEGQRKWVDETLQGIENKLIQMILRDRLYQQIEHGVILHLSQELIKKINTFFPDKNLSEELFKENYQKFLNFINEKSIPGLGELKKELRQAYETPDITIMNKNKIPPQSLQAVTFYDTKKSQFITHTAEKLNFKTLKKMQSSPRIKVYDNAVTCQFTEKKESLTDAEKKVVREAVIKAIDQIKPKNADELNFETNNENVATFAKKVAEEELDKNLKPHSGLAH